MEKIALTAQTRTTQGKNVNRRFRAAGKIPGVLYGQQDAPAMLLFDAHEFQKTTRKLGDDMVLFALSVEGTQIQNQLALIREVQRDPVTERIIHLDMMRVDVNKPIEVVVAVRGVGTPAGIADGGVLEIVTRQVHLRCLPDRVPSHMEVDISGLKINQAVHIGDLPLGEGVEMLSAVSEVLFHVIIPRLVEEAKPAAAVEGVEGAAVEGAEGAETEKKEEE